MGCCAAYVPFDSGCPFISFLNRQAEPYLVPRERVRSILMGTEQGNALKIPP